MVRNSGVDLKFKGRVKWRIVQGTIKNHNTIIIQLHIYFYFHNLFRENCKNCFTRKKGCIKNTLVFHYEVFLFKNRQKNSLQNRTAIAESKRKFFNMANVSLNTANTTCHLIYQSITSPTTYIYACLFIISGIIAAVGNTLALVILWQPQMRTKANKILRSLVVSDAMVGYFLFPHATYMMFTPITLKVSVYSCTIFSQFN